MNYLGILAILVAIAIVLVIVIVSILKKSKSDSEEYEYEDDDVDEEEDEEEEEELPARKQWKIVIENLETWEKFSFIFYDNIGIGRKKENSEFEKYLIVKDDARVSKLHCAIISNAGKLYLKDMDSRNGTYLNNNKLERPTFIQKEDIISIGETKLEIKKVMRERD
ncbi:MAG: FHA domain-containing protein [Tyzzerella sp.]|nr:FHA domain-containing protein [Tyzzerella sp.]